MGWKKEGRERKIEGKGKRRGREGRREERGRQKEEAGEERKKEGEGKGEVKSSCWAKKSVRMCVRRRATEVRAASSRHQGSSSELGAARQCSITVQNCLRPLGQENASRPAVLLGLGRAGRARVKMRARLAPSEVHYPLPQPFSDRLTVVLHPMDIVVNCRERAFQRTSRHQLPSQFRAEGL